MEDKFRCEPSCQLKLNEIQEVAESLPLVTHDSGVTHAQKCRKVKV